MTARYSVIIPFKGDPEVLKIVLESLQNQGEIIDEIIIVDDNTRCDLSFVRNIPNCKLINLSVSSGPSHARNVGAKYAKYENLFFLDADVLIPEGCFEKIDQFLKDNNIEIINFPISSYCPFTNFPSRYYNAFFRYNIITKGENTLFTSFCFVKKQCLQKVKGFEERIIHPYADDITLGWKLLNRNHKFFLLREVETIHYKKFSLLKLLTNFYFHGFYAGKWLFIYYLEKRAKKLLAPFRKKALVGIMSVLGGVILVNRGPLLLLPLLFFIILNLDFFHFIKKENGVTFMIKSIFILIFQYLIYTTGVVFGILSGIVYWKRNVRRYSEN